MMKLAFLPWLLIFPLILSLAAFATRRMRHNLRRSTETIHLVSVTLVFGLASLVGEQVLFLGEVSSFNNWLHVDALSAVFLLIIGLVGFLAGIYSVGYIRHELETGAFAEGKMTTYYGLFSFFLFTMLLAVTSNNIIMMWVAIEATTLSSAFLVGIYGNHSSLEAAWKYVIICTVGVAFGLYGTILVYSDAVNVLKEPRLAILWTEIVKGAGLLDPTIIKLAFIFILIGFGTKAGIFPMHSWLPDAHSEAPSPVSALLSAVLLNCAIFIIIRFAIIVDQAIGSGFTQTLFLVFGSISVAAAVFSMVAQRDLKRLLAYSSMENIGLILVALGLGGPMGILFGLLQTVNHSLVKSLLFFLSGNILLRYHTRKLDLIKGTMQAAPLTTVLLTGGVLALVGSPPFGVFVSKFGIISAGIGAGHAWLMILCLALLMVAFFAFLRMIGSAISGERPPDVARGEVSFSMLAPAALLMVLILVLGLYLPAPLNALLNAATHVAMTGTVPTQVFDPHQWQGFLARSNGWILSSSFLSSLQGMPVGQ